MNLTRSVAAVSVSAIFVSGCTRLFFYPDRRIHDRPERFGLAYDTPRLKSADGTLITGIFFHSPIHPAKATVVHFHGNGGNITSQWGFSAWLAREGFNVFILDYRGYGASKGRPSESGAVEDAVASLRYVRGRPDVNPEKIIVFGQSLGAAIAVAAAALSPNGVRAVVLESPFASYRSIAREKLSEFWLTCPIRWPLSFLVSDRYRPSRMIRLLPHVPVLIVHGSSDKIVPYAEGARLYEAARSPKELWTVPGGRHVQAFTVHGAKFRPRLIRFLDRALAVPPGAPRGS